MCSGDGMAGGSPSMGRALVVDGPDMAWTEAVIPWPIATCWEQGPGGYALNAALGRGRQTYTTARFQYVRTYHRCIGFVVCTSLLVQESTYRFTSTYVCAYHTYSSTIQQHQVPYECTSKKSSNSTPVLVVYDSNTRV